ncbi:MAG: hypothetical protein JSR58_05990 [Verrucomicrobia bacterium]|nr:hypothetical protein [Verrucomicrobiota bacterium]
MFRINFTLPVVATITTFLDQKYKPDFFKTYEKTFISPPPYVGRDIDREKQKNIQESITTTQRIFLAFGTHFAAHQLKKLSPFKSRPLLADALCLGLQGTLSVPSALFSLAHKTFIHPIVSKAPDNVPQFYVREYQDFIGADKVRTMTVKGEKKNFWYKPVPNMHEFFSTKMRCRPVLFFGGFLSSLFFLSTYTRNNLKVDNQDVGYFEGKNGIFNRLAQKVLNH